MILIPSSQPRDSPNLPSAEFSTSVESNPILIGSTQLPLNDFRHPYTSDDDDDNDKDDTNDQPAPPPPAATDKPSGGETVAGDDDDDEEKRLWWMRWGSKHWGRGGGV